MENASLVFAITGLSITIIGTVWSLAWWLSGQFTMMRELIFSSIEKLQATLTAKMEDHERHDDSRFNSLNNDLWEVKLRAANETLKNTKEKK